jgi:hypothetical protein
LDVSMEDGNSQNHAFVPSVESKTSSLWQHYSFKQGSLENNNTSLGESSKVAEENEAGFSIFNTKGNLMKKPKNKKKKVRRV